MAVYNIITAKNAGLPASVYMSPLSSADPIQLALNLRQSLYPS